MDSSEQPFRVLILEDNPNDMEFIKIELQSKIKAEFIFEWVSDKPKFEDALTNFHPDIILSDYNLPQFNGFEALKIVVDKDEILPFIIVTGTLSEEVAAESILRGAWDYVVKERLHRLPRAFENAIKIKNERLKARRVEAELKIVKDQESMQLKLLWDSIAYAPNSVVITEKDGTIQYVNTPFEKNTGYHSDEVIGRKPSILKSGKHDDAFYKNLWRTILSGNEWRGEIINKKKNGELIWEEVSISPISDHDGVIQYFVAIKNDISNRKQTEFALKESQHLFQTLANVVPVGIFRTSNDGKTNYVNPRWTELSGISSEKALGDGWIEAVHPNDRAELISNWQKYNTPTAEYRFLHEDGTIVWVMGTVVPEIKDNETIGYIGTVTDITDRKLFEKQLQESKNKFQSLVEDINDVLFEVDNDLLISYISPVITKITGYPPEHYVGCPLTQLIYEEDQSFIHKRATEKLLQESGSPAEFRIKDKSGKLVWIRISSKQIVTDDKITGIRGLAIDITSQKEIQNELIIAKEKAEASDKLKTAFMNNISHEIRTPLNGILGFASLITEPGISEKEKNEFFQILESSSQRLIQTVTDYMDISLITSGSIEANNTRFELASVFNDIVKKLQPRSDKKQLTLNVEIPDGINAVAIETDRELLFKILFHLTDNAIKFTHHGLITIGAEVKDEAVDFYVKDTGKGISQNGQSVIFDKFVQENLSTTRGHEGSGLGLSIVKGFVTLLGGNITIQSELEKGSTFSFTLTCKPTLIEPIVITPTSIKTENNKRPVILIAEDDPGSSMFLEFVLNHSYDLLFAEDGEQAVEQCKNHPEIQLVLMDIKMPKMSGYEATRQIRQFNKELIIIAQTAHGLVGDQEKSIESGCNDHITKPVNKDILLALIKSYIKS